MAIVQAIENGKLVDTSASSTSSSSSATSSTSSGSTLDKDSFLQLLVAQMKYQDPLEPTDNTEYVSQLATFSQLEETQNMQATLTQSQANDLVGKQVILKVTSSTTGETSYVSGQVDYTVLEEGKSYLSVNDKLYSIDDLDTVADSGYMNAVSLAKTFATAMSALPSAANLTTSDATKLTAARTSYDALTDYQKKFISSTDLEKLQKLEERMTVLKSTISNNSTASNTPSTSGTASTGSTNTGS